jgi:hypothetical protein
VATAKVNEIVTAAVIEALSKDKSGIVAEITADVLTGKDDSYGLFSYMYGGGGGGKTYLERLARDQVKLIASEAVTDWFAKNKKEIRAAVMAKMDAEALADSYVKRLTGIAAESDIDVRVDISAPDSGDDD